MMNGMTRTRASSEKRSLCENCAIVPSNQRPSMCLTAYLRS